MVQRFLGLAQFERNCKMPDPQKVSILVHLCRGLLVNSIIHDCNQHTPIFLRECDQRIHNAHTADARMYLNAEHHQYFESYGLF